MTLPIKAVAGSKTREHQRDARQPKTESAELAELAKPELAAAQQRAGEFFRQLTPSSFIADGAEIERTGADEWKEADNEFRARTLPSPATRYGVWWHVFAQKIPWSSNSNAWQAAFDEKVLSSPDPGRSRREWKLLRQYVSRRRDFFGGNLFAEMPFCWRIDERRCLEGIVDLALYDPGEKKWFILDWKTNRIAPNKIGELRAYYRPQVAAYWKAVGQITKQPVTAGIYSTATGELANYDKEELEREWARLKSLPSDEFTAETSRAEIDDSSSQLEFPDW